MFTGLFHVQPCNARPGQRWTFAWRVCGLVLGSLFGWRVAAQATAHDLGHTISYQGRLQVAGQAANGSYDFQFVLVDAAEAGQALGDPIAATLTVRQGVFSVPLAFAEHHFSGQPRWIEVRVRASAANGAESSAFRTLERQRIQFAPYAFRALTASTASTVTSVPVQSLPASVLLRNGEGKLDSSLLGADIARSQDVASLSQGLQQAQALLQVQASALAQLQAQFSALTQEQATMRQAVDAAAAPIRSGWMVASLDPADPSLLGAGFVRAFSSPEPTWANATAASAPSSRVDASGVWTGEEWLIWGGRGPGQTPLASGSGYTPATDAWVGLLAADAPEARSAHSAVWTGSEMLVWGGFGKSPLNTGARFSRARLSWEPMATQGAPSPRHQHGAAWTGRSMAVFGGQSTEGLLGDGGLYDPVQDQWSSLPTQQAPTPRAGATVLWTGDGLLVWGGETGQTGDATGAILRFGPDGSPTGWETLPVLPGFVGRTAHVSAWDGQRLVVWGGRSASRQLLSDGAILDVAAGSWTWMSEAGAPTARQWASAAWTGDELLVLGGQDASGATAQGHAWRRSTGTWRSLPSLGATTARIGGLAAWTGTDLIIFGGQAAVGGPPIDQPQRLAAAPPWHFFRRRGT